MSWIDSAVLKQTAVYWGPPVEDGDGGFTYPTPVEITCRWDLVEGTVVNPRTHDQLDTSTVMVGQAVKINGYLYLGDLDSSILGEDPENVDGAQKIIGYVENPFFGSTTEFYRAAMV